VNRFLKPAHALRLAVVAAAAGLIVAGLIVSGCGSDNKTSSAKHPPPPPAAATTTPSDTGSAKAQVLKLDADPGGALKFTKAKLTAKAGKVTLEMTNPSQLAHGIGVQGKGVDVDGTTVDPGGTSRATADLKPGTYEYYCTVPAHKAAGMTGKLVVK
jgi:plastocyanin